MNGSKKQRMEMKEKVYVKMLELPQKIKRSSGR